MSVARGERERNGQDKSEKNEGEGLFFNSDWQRKGVNNTSKIISLKARKRLGTWSFLNFLFFWGGVIWKVQLH